MNYLTFDIEEWYLAEHRDQVPVERWAKMESRVVQNTMRILEMLRNYQIKAHFFIMGWVAEQHPPLIEEILKQGHGIGYHSWWHKDISEQHADEFEAELVKGIDFFRQQFGIQINTYRAPFFSMRGDTFHIYSILVKHGIKLSSSIKTGNPGLFNQLPDEPFMLDTPHGKIIEMPLNRYQLAGHFFPYAGGGYFRLLPYFWIKKQIQASKYSMFYFHPRDFDKHIPFTRYNPILRNISNHIGTSTSQQKFLRLLQDFEYRELNQLLIQNTSLPLVQLPSFPHL